MNTINIFSVEGVSDTSPVYNFGKLLALTAREPKNSSANVDYMTPNHLDPNILARISHLIKHSPRGDFQGQ